MRFGGVYLFGAAVCLAGLSVLGCPAKEPAPIKEGSPAKEDSPADDFLANLSKHDDGAVIVTTGTEHFGKGLVTLSVYGSGTIEIINRRSGKTTLHEVELPKADVAQLGASFSEAGFTTLKTSGPPRQPGDTPVVLELRRGDSQLFRRELWHGDRYQQPGLDKILKRVDAIVIKTTDGELPY